MIRRALEFIKFIKTIVKVTDCELHYSSYIYCEKEQRRLPIPVLQADIDIEGGFLLDMSITDNTVFSIFLTREHKGSPDYKIIHHSDVELPFAKDELKKALLKVKL